MSASRAATGRRSFPAWLRKRLPSAYDPATRDVLRSLGLNTVCRSAECPNLGECWHSGTATFLIGGAVCTRNCSYCAVSKGTPGPLDAGEPDRIAEAAARLKLRHVVVTSVTRDDLPDGGAGHFAAVVRAVRAACGASIEVLVPDFRGSEDAISAVVASGPDVFNHNVEAVERLFPLVRPGADYRRSLGVLEAARRLFGRMPDGAARRTKSGLMIGMGESEGEVLAAMKDLRSSGCELVTIGQYLSPSAKHAPVAEFVAPERFDMYADRARRLGFAGVASGPFVRSSYRAADMIRR